MKKFKFTQSFTLIELITVMVIIMIIAGLIIGVGGAAREAAKKRKAEVMIATLEVAISMYHMDTGEYSADDGGTGCASLYDHLTNTGYNGEPDPPADIPGWRGPYMEFKEKDLNDDETEIVDPWGTPYNYDRMTDEAVADKWGNKESFNLWSNGPNTSNDSSGVGDTDYGDDIYNW